MDILKISLFLKFPNSPQVAPNSLPSHQNSTEIKKSLGAHRLNSRASALIKPTRWAIGGGWSNGLNL